MTAIGNKFVAQPVRVKDRIDPAQQMIRRNVVIEIKAAKKTHPGRATTAPSSCRPPLNHPNNGITISIPEQHDFFNSIG